MQIGRNLIILREYGKLSKLGRNLVGGKIMFADKRSKKIVMLAHCILNQNAKIDACAYYPGIIREVMEALPAADVGIIQLPCPELLYLGLDRQIDPGATRTIESEDTRVARRMSEKKSQELCRQIVNNIIYQVNEYQKHGFEIVGLIGIDGSPTCAVETTWLEGKEETAPGVFIK